MELCSGGDLYVRDPYSEADAQRIVRKLLSAVAYMHRCGITHRGERFTESNLPRTPIPTNAFVK